jgi:hypothetical protein
MDVVDALRSYLSGALSLGDLHAELQAGTWGAADADPGAMRARHVIAEATTADWSQEAIHDALRDVLAHETARQAQSTLQG